MTLYATKCGFELKELRFLFDGETINGCLSADQLEIDDDYCIDVVQIEKN